MNRKADTLEWEQRLESAATAAPKVRRCLVLGCCFTSLPTCQHLMPWSPPSWTWQDSCRTPHSQAARIVACFGCTARMACTLRMRQEDDGKKKKQKKDKKRRKKKKEKKEKERRHKHKVDKHKKHKKKRKHSGEGNFAGGCGCLSGPAPPAAPLCCPTRPSVRHSPTRGTESGAPWRFLADSGSSDSSSSSSSSSDSKSSGSDDSRHKRRKHKHHHKEMKDDSE